MLGGIAVDAVQEVSTQIAELAMRVEVKAIYLRIIIEIVVLGRRAPVSLVICKQVPMLARTVLVFVDV